MKVRFLADANFNQKIVAGLLLREPAIDFAFDVNAGKGGPELRDFLSNSSSQTS